MIEIGLLAEANSAIGTKASAVPVQRNHTANRDTRGRQGPIRECQDTVESVLQGGGRSSGRTGRGASNTDRLDMSLMGVRSMTISTTVSSSRCSYAYRFICMKKYNK